MKIKCMVYIVLIILVFSGCGKNESKYEYSSNDIIYTNISEEDLEDDKNDESMNNKEKVKITAEEFMAYYSITEEQVPVEYVQSYIDEFDVTSEQLEKYNLGADMLSAYELGLIYGYNVNSIFQGPSSEEALVDYMKQAEVIEFSFGMHYGSELAYGESMVIDLKEGKIYYTRQNIDDYINYELSAELSAEDVESIRAELPTHIDENNGLGDYGMSGDYTFMIKMNAADGTVKYYDGNQGDEEHFPGFDTYWKTLYKTYFGEEYEFTKPE